MKKESAGTLITRTFFRLLPIQILLAAIGAVNATVSGLFASNSVGADAMSAIGLYNPINLLANAICSLLVCGSQIICGKFMGANQMEKTQSVFSLDIFLATLFSMFYALLHVVAVMFGWLGVFTKDPLVLEYLNQYALGRAIGILPYIIGQQLAAFLSLENRMGRTTIASVVFIVVNLITNYVFVAKLRMQAFGLALASSVGLWVFMIVEIAHFFGKKSLLKIKFRNLRGASIGEVIKIGLPGALGDAYQMVRGLICNALIMAFAFSAGMSASSTVNSFLGMFWTIPGGMLTVSRMLMSVSIGEQDRRSLTDVMRNMFKWCVPLMSIISAAIIILAEPITNLYYHVPTETVYRMTVWGFRIVPLSFPIAIVAMHATCYAQTSGKTVLVHVISASDGFIAVSLVTWLLMPFISVNGYYVALVANSTISVIIALIYAIIKNKRLPRTMDEFMVIPASFGVDEKDRMDISLTTMEEVVTVSQSVMDFCKDRGIDPKRTYLAGLSLEEMAGNVIEHGFAKKKGNHSVDIRVVNSKDDLILRIKDDCMPFNPVERMELVGQGKNEDRSKNIGIRMVCGIAKKMEYQNILGMNVLTIHI